MPARIPRLFFIILFSWQRIKKAAAVLDHKPQKQRQRYRRLFPRLCCLRNEATSGPPWRHFARVKSRWSKSDNCQCVSGRQLRFARVVVLEHTRRTHVPATRLATTVTECWEKNCRITVAANTPWFSTKRMFISGSCTLPACVSHRTFARGSIALSLLKRPRRARRAGHPEVPTRSHIRVLDFGSRANRGRWTARPRRRTLVL